MHKDKVNFSPPALYPSRSRTALWTTLGVQALLVAQMSTTFSSRPFPLARLLRPRFDLLYVRGGLFCLVLKFFSGVGLLVFFYR